MLRTGEQYRASLRDGWQVWINGERVKDVVAHPAFKPIIDVRARLYDMAHEGQHHDLMSYVEDNAGERCNRALKFGFEPALAFVRKAARLSDKAK